MDYFIDHPLIVTPWKEVVYVQAGGEVLQQGAEGVCLACWFTCLVHQVQMRVGHLGTQLLKPRGSRQYDIGAFADGIVEKKIVAYYKLRVSQTLSQPHAVGK